MTSLTQSIEEKCGIWSYHNNFFQHFPFQLNKHIPENFIVNEILNNKTIMEPLANFGREEKGLFIHCVLKKKLIDTPGAIKILSKELHVPNDWIGYAGLKDAQGITFQRISIFNTQIENLQKLFFTNFSLFNFTRKKYEVNLGDLWGNRFTITLNPRSLNIDESIFINEIKERIQELDKFSFPNYFGLQRFGTNRPVSHQIGKYLLRKDFESAVKTYLTYTSAFENEKLSLLRNTLSIDWDYKRFRENIPKNYNYEIIMARSLEKYPNNYFRAFNEIPLRMKKFFISSYQSYIFNELLSKYLSNFQMDEKIITELPLISQNADFSTFPDYLQNYLMYLLKKDEIDLKNFKDLNIYFKSSKKQLRKTFISLTDYNYQINNNNLILSFSLPKSSYATMIIREITREN